MRVCPKRARTSNIGRTHISPPCGHLSYLRRGLFTCISGCPTPTKNAIPKRVNNLSTTMFGQGLPAQTKYALQRILRFCLLDRAPATRDLSHSVEMTRSVVGRSHLSHPSHHSHRYKVATPYSPTTFAVPAAQS